MLRQITLEEAIRRIGNGETVKCLVPGPDPDAWTDYQTGDLASYLNGIIPLVEEDKTPPRKETA